MTVIAPWGESFTTPIKYLQDARLFFCIAICENFFFKNMKKLGAVKGNQQGPTTLHFANPIKLSLSCQTTASVSTEEWQGALTSGTIKYVYFSQ